MLQNRALAGRRVLVVEDEYLLADDMVRSLRRLGADVLGPAPTLAEAMDTVRDGPQPDIAVLDINLRDETCYPLIDELRRRGIPYIIASGYDAAVVPIGYRQAPHWVKPFNPDQLARALTELVLAPAADRHRTEPLPATAAGGERSSA